MYIVEPTPRGRASGTPLPLTPGDKKGGLIWVVVVVVVVVGGGVLLMLIHMLLFGTYSVSFNNARMGLE